MTLGTVLTGLVRHPVQNIVRRWNWKAALCSAWARGIIFCVVNLSAGPAAGLQAMLTEFALRAATSGFYGAITQALSQARPAWAGSLCALALMPTIAHSAEFFVHRAAGTVLLNQSILASIAFTILTTSFNTFAMRRGVLTVGPESRSLRADIRALPGTIVEFVAVVPRALRRSASSRAAAAGRVPGPPSRAGFQPASEA